MKASIIILSRGVGAPTHTHSPQNRYNQRSEPIRYLVIYPGGPRGAMATDVFSNPREEKPLDAASFQGTHTPTPRTLI